MPGIEDLSTTSIIMAATTTTSTSIERSDYCQDYLPPLVLEKLEAGAFRRLCDHLQKRSDTVQNIDLMTVGGFCRNCLAKWMVVEARRLSDELAVNDQNSLEVRQALDALGYDEAAQYVYGMDYGDWKKRHMKDASEEQMKRFNESQPIQAQHDKRLLETRGAKPTKGMFGSQRQGTTSSVVVVDDKNVVSGTSPSILSDVCCQDVEEIIACQTGNTLSQSLERVPEAPKGTRDVPKFQPPLPPAEGITISLAVLTISDRASANMYEGGDLSGPAVIHSVQSIVEKLTTNETPVVCKIVATSTVPDELERIQDQLKAWCDGKRTTSAEQINLILTTGGTGFAPRDVTPEATRSILDRECHGLLSFVTTECSTIQPLASLSRGTAGLRGNTFIANLPGNPKGVEQMVPILLPILLHAINDLR